MNQREASRTNWALRDQHHVTEAEINSGSLQRIADATDKMAQSWTNLERDRDYWKREAQRERERASVLTFRIRSLRGAITRLKNKGKS